MLSGGDGTLREGLVRRHQQVRVPLDHSLAWLTDTCNLIGLGLLSLSTIRLLGALRLRAEDAGQRSMAESSTRPLRYALNHPLVFCWVLSALVSDLVDRAVSQLDDDATARRHQRMRRLFQHDPEARSPMDFSNGSSQVPSLALNCGCGVRSSLLVEVYRDVLP